MLAHLKINLYNYNIQTAFRWEGGSIIKIFRPIEDKMIV